MNEERAEYLVERYGDALLRVGYTWLGNLADAQDVCQITLMKALEDGRTFPDPGRERAWLLRVAINVCKNLKKSAWYRRTVGLDEGLELSVQIPEPEEDGVLPLVQRLPPRYRQVIYLRYYEEYEVGEIARLLGVKPALVSTRLARARAKLKRMWEGTRDGTAVQE